MIKYRLSEAAIYVSLSENLKKGLDWLKKINFEEIADGKYIIDGEKVFADVQSYVTKSEAPFEAHRWYIDIQYMAKGTEKIRTADYSDCSMVTNYDEERDIEFLSCTSNVSEQILDEGEFLILYPNDAHSPSLAVREPVSVKKIVVKVRSDEAEK